TLLVALWALGRLVQLIGAWLPLGLVIGADLAFPIALTATVAHELIAARNRRNYVMIVPLVVLTGAQLLMDLATEGGVATLAGYGWRLGLAATLILVSVLGARIVPGFTRNWLLSRRREPPPASERIGPIASALLHTALMAWVFFPQARWVGVLLLGGAILTLWRLLRWRGVATRDEPLLLVLHVGYAWLVAGVAALGIATLTPTFPLAAAIHALTAGAIGTMILAVMTRVSRGHTGRALTADRATTVIYFLVVFAATARIAAALVGRAEEELLIVAALLWIGAFGLFVLRYAPFLVRPRPME
ncbi:MAG: NnrS family protein, partial [Gallionella sp.]|nr:NnrS family protein [Gallionella sp.]